MNFFNTRRLYFVAGLLFCMSSLMAGAEKPNILLITADDLAPWLGAYGHPIVKSPNLDTFAEQAVVFEEMHCNVSICTASRTSILTGVRPSTSGLYNLNHNFKKTLPYNVSLPRHFSNNGYFTQAMGKIADRRGGDWSGEWDQFHFGYKLKPEKAVTALRKLVKQHKPWLLAVGFSEPHCPWKPSKASLALYENEDIQPHGPGRILHNSYMQDCYAPGDQDLPRHISDEQAIDITRRYYATVTDLDRKVGTVLDETKKLGIFDNTIIIFWCGDHGFHLGENGRWGKWETYRADTRIPLMMRVPGKGKAGTRVAGLVEAVDMYPTLVDLAGLPAPASALEGLSFSPLLDAPKRPWKKAVFSYDIQNQSRSIKTHRYNLIMEKNGSKKELYDMIADPRETKNLAKERPEVVTELVKLYQNGWKKAGPDFQATSTPEQ